MYKSMYFTKICNENDFNVNINIDVAKCTFVQCKLYLSDLLTFLSL